MTTDRSEGTPTSRTDVAQEAQMNAAGEAGEPGDGVQLRTRAAFRMGLVWAMRLVVAVYVAALALHGVGWGPTLNGWYGNVVNNWLGLSADWLPSAVCWLAASRVGFRRPAVLLVAAGVTSFALADT